MARAFITATSLGIFLLFFPLASLSQNASKNIYFGQGLDIEQETYRPLPALPPENKNVVKGPGFEATLGFEDYTERFSISTPKSVIDYGKIYPTNPVIRDLKIEIGQAPPFGYEILAFEDHPLADASYVHIIPATSCDRGLCSSRISAEWKENLTYGLGYRCELEKGNCPGFESADTFKKFANESKNEEYQDIFGSGFSNSGKIKIYYKLNISSTQPNVVYSNTSSFIALPRL
jgi:hypothetical protein